MVRECFMGKWNRLGKKLRGGKARSAYGELSSVV